MLKVKVVVDTDKGKGHVEFIAKDETVVTSFLQTFKNLCEETYQWYKIVSIEKRAIDEDTGQTHSIN